MSKYRILSVEKHKTRILEYTSDGIPFYEIVVMSQYVGGNIEEFIENHHHYKMYLFIFDNIVINE